MLSVRCCVWLVTFPRWCDTSDVITQLKEGEWMVEPADEHCREYARLHIKAVKRGVNIDGQGIILWHELLAKKIRLAAKLPKTNGR